MALTQRCAQAEVDRDKARARVAELEAELPDDYSESKDWRHGNAVSRIQWLKAMLEATRGEVERLESQF